MTFQRLLSIVVLQLYISEASRSLQPRDTGDVTQVISARLAPLSLRCNADVRLSYCWFRHPNGTQFPVQPSVPVTNTDLFWFSGNGLETGECGITIITANDTEAGMWECRMGGTDFGIEIVQLLNVRITGPLAAVEREIRADIGDQVDIQCITAGGPQNLEHCRFLLPNGIGIHINEKSNESNAIMGRYFLKPGTNIHQGNCAVTIASIEEEDFGEWTCAGQIEGLITESHDSVILIRNISTSIASTIGVVIGVVAVVGVVAIGGFATWQRKRKTTSQQRHTRQGIERMEMTDIELPKLSVASESSDDPIFDASMRTEEVTIDPQPSSSGTRI